MLLSAQRLRSLPGRPGGARWGTYVAAMVTLLGIGACGGSAPSEHEIAYAQTMRPGVELAANATEEQALQQAPALPTGEPTRLAGGVVVAGPIYMAASGRRCREMTVGPRQRLACEDRQAEVWVFVPDVFSIPAPSAGSEDASSRSTESQPAPAELAAPTPEASEAER